VAERITQAGGEVVFDYDDHPVKVIQTGAEVVFDYNLHPERITQAGGEVVFDYDLHPVRVIQAGAEILTWSGHIDVVLTWNDNSYGESGFKIERSDDGIIYAQIDEVGANITTYTDTLGVEAAGNTYYYRVRAYNIEGNTPYSNVATAVIVQIPPFA